MAIKSLKNNKASGLDNLLAGVYKEGGILLHNQLYQLIIDIWVQGEIPGDLKDELIVTICKKKGDKTEWQPSQNFTAVHCRQGSISNYRQPTQPNRRNILPESQSGFRPSRRATDMIFSVSQLQNKCHEQRQPLYLAFIDLTKAFDIVHRGLLRHIFAVVGCPEKFINIVRLLHDGMSAQVLNC